jgi:hypothetical protein
MKEVAVRRIALSFLMTLLAFALAPISAQASHLRGLRVVVTSVNVGTLTADVDVTLWTDGTATVGVANQGFGNLPAAGIHWGDGSSNSFTATAIVAGPPAQYRASLSHVYPNATTRTITVRNCCMSGGTSNTITGNRLDTPSYNGETTYISDTVLMDFAGAPTLPDARVLGALALTMMGAGWFLLRRREAPIA